MSLYNLLNDVNPDARVALAILGLSPDDFGRFRDAWFTPQGTIEVFTRCGGGNRDDYEDVFARMRSHPNFVADFDDEFDYTYATFAFKPDSRYDELIGRLRPNEKQPTLREKTDAAIDAIKDAPLADSPQEKQSAVERVEALLRSAIDAERQERPVPKGRP